LEPLWDHLDQAGIGHVSELADGDKPWTPKGCIAQAWSVAELIRVLYEDLRIQPTYCETAHTNT
jgi:glycogen debranching enzyme